MEVSFALVILKKLWCKTVITQLPGTRSDTQEAILGPQDACSIICDKDFHLDLKLFLGVQIHTFVENLIANLEVHVSSFQIEPISQIVVQVQQDFLISWNRVLLRQE